MKLQWSHHGACPAGVECWVCTCCQRACEALWTTSLEYPNVLDRKADRAGCGLVKGSCLPECTRSARMAGR